MQFRVEVKGIEGVREALRQLPRDLRDQAAAMAVNKVADKARTETTRAITAEYAIDASRVRNSVQIRRASVKQDQVMAVLSIFGSGRRKGRSLNLVHFLEKKVTLAEARRRLKAGTQQELRFRIKRSGGLVTVPGAFLGNGGRTVFRRVGKSRLPIEPLQVIDVPQMFTARKVNARVMERIRTEMPVEVQRAVQLLLSRRGGVR